MALGRWNVTCRGHFKGYDANTTFHDLLRIPNRDRLFAVYEALARGESQSDNLPADRL